LRGGIRARERLLAWDENRRFAYRVEEVNMPGIRAFVEEWTVAPVAQDRTELRWTLACDCAGPAGLMLRAASNRIGHMFSAGTRKMAATLWVNRQAASVSTTPHDRAVGVRQNYPARGH
jgi:Polyketide cyclase / dehydrase and lipid transport